MKIHSADQENKPNYEKSSKSCPISTNFGQKSRMLSNSLLYILDISEWLKKNHLTLLSLQRQAYRSIERKKRWHFLEVPADDEISLTNSETVAVVEKLSQLDRTVTKK